MNNVFTKIALALPFLTLVGCAAPDSDPAATSAADMSTTGRDAVRVEATWHYVVVRTPNIGDNGEEPLLTINLRVDDESVRGDGHTDFDGLEKPYALVPHADGSNERIELGFTGTSLDGFIQLYKVDEYTHDLLLNDADLAVVKQKGITVTLATNVGDIESDNAAVSAKNL